MTEPDRAGDDRRRVRHQNVDVHRITIIDTKQTRESHAPVNRCFVDLIRLAFPQVPISLHAHASHIEKMFADPSAALANQIDLLPLQHPPSSYRSLLSLIRLYMKVSLGASSKYHFIVFLTSEPEHIFVAKIMARFFPKCIFQLIIHGDIANIQYREGRNPLRYIRGYAKTMRYGNHKNVRFIVLEEHIFAAVCDYIPELKQYIDVVPHPCTANSMEAGQPPRGGEPLRFTLLGIAGASKGLDTFARVAAKVKLLFGNLVDFRIAGKLQPGWQDLDLHAVSGPMPFREDWLSREEFEHEIRQAHFIVLPYKMKYYHFAASGVLLDAISFGKAIIAHPAPQIVKMSEEFGNFGYLCDNEVGIISVITDLVKHFDSGAYTVHCENAKAAYRSRLPHALVQRYLAICAYGFGIRGTTPPL